MEKTHIKVTRYVVLAAALAFSSVAQAAGDSSSAIAPIGGPSQEGPSSIFPGQFGNARRVDAVVIHNGEAKLCRAPDFERCHPLGQALPVLGTVATTVNGTSKLLVLDSLQSIRACDVETTGRGASLACKAVDFNRLADYNMATLADGQILSIEGTDGKYMCSAGAGGGARCLQVTDSSGTFLHKTVEQRRLENRLGTPFKPLDDPDRVCRYKSGAITCKPLKLSELIGALREPATIVMPEEEITGQRWSDNAFSGVQASIYNGESKFSQQQAWQSDPITTPPKPPTYWKDLCYQVCDKQNTDYGDVCTMTFAVVAAIFAGVPAIPAAYLAACKGGQAYHNQQCRSICDASL